MLRKVDLCQSARKPCAACCPNSKSRRRRLSATGPGDRVRAGRRRGRRGFGSGRSVTSPAEPRWEALAPPARSSLASSGWSSRWIWYFFAPPALGGSTTYVFTDGVSMEPRFHTGDLVLVRSQSSYHVGEIVAYRNECSTRSCCTGSSVATGPLRLQGGQQQLRRSGTSGVQATRRRALGPPPGLGSRRARPLRRLSWSAGSSSSGMAMLAGRGLRGAPAPASTKKEPASGPTASHGGRVRAPRSGGRLPSGPSS